MKIFLHDKSNASIAKNLEAVGVQMFDSRSEIPNQLGGNFTWNALERVDGIILEISQTSDELNYFIAQAIVLQRPTLCLYLKHNPPREIMQYLQRASIPKTITLKSYTDSRLEHVLITFLRKIKPTQWSNEIPNIKFTLRLTDTIDDYLHWLTDFQKINKAEYIRDLIKKDALNNNDYAKRHDS